MRKFCFAAVFAGCSCLASAQTVPPVTSSSAPSGSVAALPSVEKFFGRPKYSQVTLSPDGQLLAALVPYGGRANVALIDIDKGTIRMLTTLPNQDVASYGWIGTRLLEVTAGDITDASGVASIKQVVVIDTAGNVVRNMRPPNQRRVGDIVSVIDDAGEDVILVSRDRNVDSLDAYRFNPRTNQKQLLTLETPGDVRAFIADHAGQVRAAVSVSKDGARRRVSYRRTNEERWTTLRDEPVEAVTLTPLGFAYDNKTMYVAASAAGSGGRTSVFAFDPDHDALGPMLYENSRVDAGGLVFDRVNRKLAGFRDDSPASVTWIDPDWKHLQESIDAAMPKTHNYLRWARDETSRVVVFTESETQPPVYYLLDRKTHKMEEVAAAYPDLDEKELSPRQRVQYVARDGLTIPAYLTMPRRAAGARPPLIVDIHGGPFVRGARFGYNEDAQFFASRGYAVLQPNFRGTTGYGAAFEQAGWKQWGLAMQDDITDGVKWLIDNGKVDGDRVCLFGASYGGYATLWGLEREPRMFRCGVAFVAVSDLDLLFDVNWSDTNRNDRYGSSTNFYKRTIGDPDRDREKLREVSPLYHVDRIQAPLLLAYGAADVRVPLIHGNRMRSALDKAGKSYEWVVYDDEGHGFNKDENKFDFYRRVDAFLAKNLVPRAAKP